MKRALLDPRFSPTEQRWGDRLEKAMWLASTMLLLGLIAWAAGPA